MERREVAPNWWEPRDLSELLVQLRDRTKKTQEELSKMMKAREHDVTAQAISSWEKGKRMSPGNLRPYINLLAELVGVDSEALLQMAFYYLAVAHGEDKPRLLLWGSDLRERSLVSVPRRTHDT
jgi:transcriptional regulator with XRE-family HTH domain